MSIVKKATDSGKVNVLVMSGVEGWSLYIDNYRVAGPKPWGGGHVMKEWNVDRADIENALSLRIISLTNDEDQHLAKHDE